MEEEEGLEVVGTVINFNRGAGFVEVTASDGSREICLFRPNKLIVDGQKVPSSKLKTVEGLQEVGVGRVYRM